MLIDSGYYTSPEFLFGNYDLVQMGAEGTPKRQKKTQKTQKKTKKRTILYYIILYYTILYRARANPVLSCPVVSCPVVSYPIRVQMGVEDTPKDM